MNIEYKVKKADSEKTIHSILTNNFQISTRLMTRLIKNEKITVNKNKCDTRNKAKIGDSIVINFEYAEDNSNIIPTKMDLKIIYEDEWMLVVNKPAGIPVHPSLLHYTDSLSNGVKYYFDKISLAKKIRPVNRLDLDTSGVIIFAKCEYIQECFINQMKSKQFQKEYICLVDGVVKPKEGTINLPIARKNGSIIERCVDKINGQNAITHYKVIKEFNDFSLIKCILETGRTHQIRVHMLNIGHPILSDTLYGKKSKLIERQALHSLKIECIHPVTKEPLTFESSLPKDLKNIINK